MKPREKPHVTFSDQSGPDKKRISSASEMSGDIIKRKTEKM